MVWFIPFVDKCVGVTARSLGNTLDLFFAAGFLYYEALDQMYAQYVANFNYFNLYMFRSRKHRNSRRFEYVNFNSG